MTRTYTVQEEITVDTMESESFEEAKNLDYEIEKSVVKYNPQDVLNHVHGMQLIADAPFAYRVAALRFIGKFIGGETIRIDRFLNSVVWVSAAMQHDVQIKKDKPVIDEVTGETREYVPGVRTVVHVIAEHYKGHPEAKVFNPPIKVSFVSVAIARYFGEFINPLFGIGKFEEPIPLIFKKIPARGGQTYTVSPPEKEELEFPG